MIITKNLNMLDDRLPQLNQWLTKFFGHNQFQINTANDDASFRRYFRIECKNQSFIAMDAPPDKEDCSSFVNIGNFLHKNNIRTPKIFAADINQGFLLLEDFGTTTLLDANHASFNIKRYQHTIRMIIKLQSIEKSKITHLPQYDSALLKKEMLLFVEWYLKKDLDKKQYKVLQRLFNMLAANTSHRCNQVFVHRDYHSRNLMVLGTRGIGVLDFQDAVVGSRNYDLCSLLRDAYYELDVSQLQMLLEYYFKEAKVDMPFIKFKKQFDFTTLQRCLKMLGIFSRLSIRDGKHHYLQNIPLVRKYALTVCQEYEEFHILEKLI